MKWGPERYCIKCGEKQLSEVYLDWKVKSSEDGPFSIRVQIDQNCAECKSLMMRAIRWLDRL